MIKWIQDVEDSFVASRKSVLNFRATALQEHDRSAAKRTYDITEQSFKAMCSGLETLVTSRPLPETLQ